MGIHNFIKNGKYSKRVYNKMVDGFFCIATIISPRLNTILRYYFEFKKIPNFSNPITFNEKLLWLKLNKYINSSLVAMCADKYRVREYVQTCGCAEILNEIYGVYSHARDIQWEKLPQQFVLKCNFGAGMNIVCKDKEQLSEKQIKKQFDRWMRSKPWLLFSEMQYRNTTKRIVCEKFLSDSHEDSLVDYKVYCFHGEPKAIFVMHDREHDIKTEFFDTDWKPLDNSCKYGNVAQVSDEPKCLNHMLECARKLSKPFEFVRCDFYIVNGRLYFGELTFTPAGGLFTSTTKIHGVEMCELLRIDRRKK